MFNIVRGASGARCAGGGVARAVRLITEQSRPTGSPYNVLVFAYHLPIRMSTGRIKYWTSK